jgi:hypothetical protein
MKEKRLNFKSRSLKLGIVVVVVEGGTRSAHQEPLEVGVEATNLAETIDLTFDTRKLS